MECYNPDLHHRHSIRLKGYDYSKTGAYFVTICTKNRECLFGEIVEGVMQLNEYGETVQECWNNLERHYTHVRLDAFVVMPNHVHGVIMLDDRNVGAGLKPAPTVGKRHGLPEIIRAFKTFSSRRINVLRKEPGVPLWQRNYYEHIIRDEEELNRFREYIQNNPMQWEMDEENPERNAVKNAKGMLPTKPSLAKQLLKERKSQFK